MRRAPAGLKPAAGCRAPPRLTKRAVAMGPRCIMLGVAALWTPGGTHVLKEFEHKTEASQGGRLRHHRGGNRASLLQRAQSGRQAPPLFVPKIGLANITKPTAYPPPPPVIDTWNDYQPIDTYIGNQVVTAFAEPLTSTPPPSQASLDLAFGCPTLLGFPAMVDISAPDPCVNQIEYGWTGAWNDTNQGLLLKWEQQCQANAANIAPMASYSMPNGDVFGYSQDIVTPAGSYIQLTDCMLKPKYTVEEKIYKQIGPPDADLCKECGSCDGKIFLQYFVYTYAPRKLIATTAWVGLFADGYDITDPGGNKIAKVTRMGGWKGCHHACDPDATGNRNWRIEWADSAPAPLGTQTERWALSMIMTMFSIRDTARQPTGFIGTTGCESAKVLLDMTLFVTLIIAMLVIPTIWYFTCMAPTRDALFKLEQMCCMKRMSKPARYEGS